MEIIAFHISVRKWWILMDNEMIFIFDSDKLRMDKCKLPN